jgi:hypothetical protein
MEAVAILTLFIVGGIIGWQLLVRFLEKDTEPEYNPNALWLERLQELNRDQR